jgi:hypothetical protein
VVLLQLGSPAPPRPPDTLRVRAISHPPAAAAHLDSALWGTPQVMLSTAQGSASVWLLRAADSLFIVARIPDRSPSWGDGFTMWFDVSGDGGSLPGHDDFQFSFRRALDSSVVYRGRADRWTPPLDDPDWRLGVDRSGGGWDVAAADDAGGWTLVLRMDPAWLEGEGGRRPALAFLIHDDDPNRWYPWPPQRTSAGATLLEWTPALWVPIE